MLAYQKANVAILIGLLAAVPAEKYNHAFFGFGYEATDGREDTGCALGLAMANAEKFTDEDGQPFERVECGLGSPSVFSDKAFGDDAWYRVFTLRFDNPTRDGVLADLKAYGESEITA